MEVALKVHGQLAPEGEHVPPNTVNVHPPEGLSVIEQHVPEKAQFDIAVEQGTLDASRTVGPSDVICFGCFSSTAVVSATACCFWRWRW